MESAAKNVRELQDPAHYVSFTTRTATTAGQNLVNQVGENVAGRTSPT